MAFSPGYDATFSVGGTDISAFLKSVKFSPARKDYELPVLGGGQVHRMVGPVSTVIDLEGYQDHTVTTIFTGALSQAVPTSSAFSYSPQGAGGGVRSGNAFIVDFIETTSADGAGTWTAKMAVDGTVTMS